MKCNKRYPNILIISNNSLSEINNNGKTLASFFDEYPSEKISQLYFSSEVPDSQHCKNYFRITDSEMVRIFINRSNHAGKKINCSKKTYTSNLKNKKKNSYDFMKNSNVFRLFREFIWSTNNWKSTSLDNWLDQFSPDIIFFCAGDSGFAYDITDYVQKKYNTKLATYITDDYILPRKKINLFWWIRRNFIFKKMKSTIIKSDSFITISNKMRIEYKKVFNKDSTLAINMVESMKKKGNISEHENVITLVYAGGLHFKRYKTLNLLAKAIQLYNDDEDNKKKAVLKIYSAQNVTKKILNYLNVKNASEFCGKLDSSELKKVLNKCDIPVHVESFDKKSIESTRLSISTKIPEYLSLEKPILAIGPVYIASMEYIRNIAFCITNPSDIPLKLNEFLNNKELQKIKSKKAIMQYEKKHNKENVSHEFISELISLANWIK